MAPYDVESGHRPVDASGAMDARLASLSQRANTGLH